MDGCEITDQLKGGFSHDVQGFQTKGGAGFVFPSTVCGDLGNEAPELEMLAIIGEKI